MENLLVDKMPHHPPIPARNSCGNSSQEPMISPRSRIVVSPRQHQSKIAKLLSNVGGPLKSPLNQISSPKHFSFQRNYANGNANNGNVTDKSISMNEEAQVSLRHIKNQPRISRNLPSVFTNELRNNVVKLK